MIQSTNLSSYQPMQVGPASVVPQQEEQEIMVDEESVASYRYATHVFIDWNIVLTTIGRKPIP